jgi:hypothetical protein
MADQKRRNPDWMRTNTAMMRSPKIMRLLVDKHGAHAFVVWFDALLWSQENLTDGLIPTYWRPGVVPFNGAPKLLCDVGLWLAVTDGMRQPMPGQDESPLAQAAWLINNFRDYGVTRAEWEDEGRDRSERNRRNARKRWGKEGDE